MQSQKKQDIYAFYSNPHQFNTQIVSGEQFRIPNQYQLLEFVGSGGYGKVCAAWDKINQKVVVLKKINQMEQTEYYLKKILREMKILRNINHLNVIKLLGAVLPQSRSAFQDVQCIFLQSYLIFQLSDISLRNLIKFKFQSLTIEHVQFFTAQIIFEMMCLHRNGILHRDLVKWQIIQKPQNILINKNSDLKICDFGLSRIVNKDDMKNGLTDYVVTRYYRPPQLLLNISKYTEAVDIWCIGCVIAQMLIGKPLFKSDNKSFQMNKIIEFCGLELDDVISYGPAEQQFFLQNYDTGPGNNEFLFDICPEGADLVMNFLKIDPTQRMSLEDALTHPFIEKYTKQFVFPPIKYINPLEFQFEKEKLSKTQLKDLIYEEILLYHFPQFSSEYLKRLENKESVISHILGEQTFGQNGETMKMEEENSMECHF